MIIVDAFAWLGRAVIEWLRALGHNAFFFLDVVRNIPSSLRRPGLVIKQIHAVGNLSLVIICASGLAVGFVLVNFLVDLLYAVLDPRVRNVRA